MNVVSAHIFSVVPHCHVQLLLACLRNPLAVALSSASQSYLGLKSMRFYG